MDEKVISDNLKKLRIQRKLTLQNLAEKTGLTKVYLSKVERSKKAPPYSTLTKIAGALDLDMMVLRTGLGFLGFMAFLALGISIFYSGLNQSLAVRKFVISCWQRLKGVCPVVCVRNR